MADTKVGETDAMACKPAPYVSYAPEPESPHVIIDSAKSCDRSPSSESAMSTDFAIQ